MSNKIDKIVIQGLELYKMKSMNKVLTKDESRKLVTETTSDLKKMFIDSDFGFNDSEKKLITAHMNVNIQTKDNELEINQISINNPDWLSEQGQPKDKNKPTLHYDHWNRFKTYIDQKQNMNIDYFEKQVRAILRNMPDPQNYDENWLSRGLVVGNVQSGKTTNYIGLMNMAVDVGYKIIIVLAGAGNDLRRQTQIRIEEGLTGRNSLTKSKIGIQSINQPGDFNQIASYTSRAHDGDFSSKIQKGINFSETWSKKEPPLLFVIKKNKTVLENLEKFLQGRTDDDKKIPSPLLLIDDECDYASINTKKKEDSQDPEYDPSTINKCIRGIMHRFERSSYVGYTATPYGNIFIETEDKDGNPKNDESVFDLFPDNFIINLGSNDLYSGPKLMFPTDSSDDFSFFREVDYHEWDYFGSIIKAKNRILRESGLDVKEDKVERSNIYQGILDAQYEDQSNILNKQLTIREENGLTEAIRAFILSCAIRNLRGYNESFNTMLIHVNRENLMQAFLKRIIDDIYAKLDTEIFNQEFEKFEALFYNDYKYHTDDYLASERIPEVLKEGIDPLGEDSFTFEKIKDEILDIFQRKQILTVVQNAKSKDTSLSYEEKDRGTYYICIGGDILSRGFTIEGLSVSYFLRHAKTQDTLLQMGRWFGYRTGYLDLCRVYTTSGINDDFTFTTMAQAELFDTFSFMEENNLTPRDFGLKIANSRGTLQVTGLGKRRTAKNAQVDFTEFSQYGKWMKLDKVKHNAELLKGLIYKLKDEKIKDGIIPNHIGGFISEKTLSRYRIFDIQTHKMLEFLDEYDLNTIKNQKGFITDTTLSNALRQVLRTQNSFKVIVQFSSENKTGGQGYQLFDESYIFPRERYAIDNYIENNTVISGKAMTIADDKSIADFFNRKGYPTMLFTLHHGFNWKDRFNNEKTNIKDKDRDIKKEIKNEMESISLSEKIKQKNIYWGYDEYPVLYHYLKLPRYDQLGLSFEDAFVSYLANETEQKNIDELGQYGLDL
jgi:hypothetical protein